MTDTSPQEQRSFTLRSLTFSVYVPTLLFSIGQGAVLPIIPLFALELGDSTAVAGFVVVMPGLGLMLFDVPGGVAVSRFGDKGVMVLGTAMVALVAVGASLSKSPVVLLVGAGATSGGSGARVVWGKVDDYCATASTPGNLRDRCPPLQRAAGTRRRCASS